MGNWKRAARGVLGLPDASECKIECGKCCVGVLFAKFKMYRDCDVRLNYGIVSINKRMIFS